MTKRDWERNKSLKEWKRRKREYENKENTTEKVGKKKTYEKNWEDIFTILTFRLTKYKRSTEVIIIRNRKTIIKIVILFIIMT